MPINQENYSQNQLDLIKLGTAENQQLDSQDYVRLSVYEEATDAFVGRFYSNQLTPDSIPQIEVYDLNGTISVKPNEILEANYVAGGNYKLEFDFLQNVFKSISDTAAADNPKFIITEIAPSRKEIRVIARNGVDDILFDDSFISQFMSSLSPNGSYTYDWVLTFNKDKNISINNYTFDEISNPEKISLILRLDKPIPVAYKRLDKLNIEKEVINTQTQNIIYVSNITSTFAGSGLTPDPSVWTREVVYEADSAENYEQLVVSSSFTENTFNDIVTKQKGEVNLNVDFSKFENHVFFGSAKKKLQNFKTKVGKIQGQLNLISQSLSTAHNVDSFTGSAIPDLRKNAFNEITNIKKTFTPYEKFLYDDNQSYSTSSAPGLGLNHAHTIPVTQNSGQYSLLTNQEGFKVVHKHEPNPAGNTYIDLFTDQYFADDTPFFNYTGSLYLSFLMKADDTISDTMHADQDIGNGRFVWENSNKGGYGGYPRIPQEALYQEFILRPNTTGSHFQRFILHASQSHWRPTGSVTLNDAGVQDASLIPQTNTSFTGNNNVYYSILSSSVQVTSASMTHTEKISLPENYSGLGTSLTSSNYPFHGSVLPAGELFRIYYRAQDISGTEATASFITDVKITKNNPLNTQPFSFIYPTGSTEFDTWYNGIYSQAETYDNNNIHSLVHNVPEQVITSSNDVQTFLDMWGEHFDGVRNHIDTFKTFYNRSYNEKTSMPSNLLPILGANLGWELINPFSSSLSDYFSTLTGSLSTMQDVTNNTWRKIINNLVYVYKSKGTQNSLRALLNIYGYPPDLITVTEHGGSMQEHNPIILDNTFTPFNSGLKASTGNVSFVEQPILYRMMSFPQPKELRLDWNYNGATPTAGGFEFTMIPTVTNTSMSLIESSGSLTQSFWDLCYVPSASSPTIGSLRFRLSHNPSINDATSSLMKNTVSASTDYFTIGNDRMFNVYVGQHQDLTAANPVLDYSVVVSSKENDSINLLTTGSLDVVGKALTGKLPSVTHIVAANYAFVSTGSRHPLSSSNLYVGRTYTGSIADIRLWKCMPSASKLKQHTLNPPSIVYNEVNPLDKGLVYRFKLNENTLSGSSARIKDSNPNNVRDFSKNLGFNVNNGTYITKIIDTFKFIPRTDGVSHKNTNMVTTDMDRGFMKHNLSPIKNSFNPNLDEKSNNKREVSEVVSFTKSPIDKIDDYITQVLADKDISQYFSKWSDTYEPFYKDLDDLRNKIMNGVSVDINKYINTVAKLFNPSIIEAVESILPLSSRFEKGVEIRQSILERNKIEYKKSSVFRIPVHLGTLENIYNISSNIINVPKGNLQNHQPDLSLSFITPPKGEIQTSKDGYTYSINYLSIYNSNNINIYEDIVNFNVKNIELINFNTISLINQDNNFKINFVNPIQSNVMDLYNDFINYEIKYITPLDVILSNTNGKTQLYNFSINNINNFINFDIIDVYEDFVNYNINYLKIYNANLQNWPFEQITTEYLKLLETKLQEHKFKEFSVSYLSIHQFNVNEWEYQSFGMNYLSLYQSNKLSIIKPDDFSYNQLKLEYNNISENKLKRWPFESFGGSFINVYSDNLENWPFENFNITKLNIIEENIEQWPFESFSSNYNKVYETDIQLNYDSEFNKDEYSLSLSETDSTEATLSMQFFISATTKANNPANWDGGTITLTDSNGLTKTYIFDDDGDDTTGGLDGSGRVIVQVIGISAWQEVRTALNAAVAHANGHNGSIRTRDSSKGIVFTQDVGGNAGNTSVPVTGLNALDEGTSVGGVAVSSASSFTTSFTGGVDYQFKNYMEKRDKFKMEYIDVYSKDVYDVQNLMWVDRKQSPLKTWGTNLSDTWIMNMAVSGSGSRNYNTGYYNDTVLNYMIKDMEHLSGSRKKKICAEILQSNELLDYDRACVDPEDYCDSSDWRCFHNRLVLDDGLTGDIYQSYFGDSGGTAPIKGRPIGRTTFIATASNGDLIYPSNHHINYSTTKDQMRFLFYEKTPTAITVVNRNNEFDETDHNKGIQFEGDLFPKQSVYTLQVEGADTENILRVEKKTDRPKLSNKEENIRKGRRNINKNRGTGPKY